MSRIKFIGAHLFECLFVPREVSLPIEETPLEAVVGKVDILQRFTKAWAMPTDPSTDSTPSSEWIQLAMAQQDAIFELPHRTIIRNMLLDGRRYLRQLGCLMDGLEGKDFFEAGQLKAVWRDAYTLSCRIQWCMFRLAMEAEELGIQW